MNLYPALRASMGDWVYYIVKMKMRELAQEVMFASEVHTDATLDEAIQRALNESRAKTSIVDFLRRRDDRFFASIAEIVRAHVTRAAAKQIFCDAVEF